MKTTIKFPEGLVASQYNTTSLSALVTTTIVGLMLIFSHDIIDFEDTPLTSSLTSGGVIVAIIAAAALSFALKRAVLASSASPLVCKTIEFDEEKYGEVGDAIEAGDWNEVMSLAKSSSSASMKLEFIYSKDRGFAAYQFFKYVPHIYEPCSEIIYLDKEGIEIPKLK